jgi:hypothetical protein
LYKRKFSFSRLEVFGRSNLLVVEVLNSLEVHLSELLLYLESVVFGLRRQQIFRSLQGFFVNLSLSLLLRLSDFELALRFD